MIAKPPHAIEQDCGSPIQCATLPDDSSRHRRRNAGTDVKHLPTGRRALAAIAILPILAGCKPAEEVKPPEVRPVRVVTVEQRTAGDVLALTGTVQAQTQVDLAFRVDGRMIERLVNVGDRVEPGQVIAWLDQTDAKNALRSARAALLAAEGQLLEAQNDYQRQAELLRGGWTPRARYDQAAQVRQTALARVDDARAQLNIAQNRLGWTVLEADAAGIVTARGAEPGEVVGPGRMIVQLARTDGRDAVFDVPPAIKDAAPPDPEITVGLTMDPTIQAKGRVREVSPRADPVTGTFQVRVGLVDPPPGLRLGSTVTGRMQSGAGGGIELPASALTSTRGSPAVWVVDQAAMTVALRAVEVLRHDPATVLLAGGVEAGDVVVTAGVQALRPGQKVRLLGARP
jgi:RND family efflux transporter MFP subunit